jgi:hypothetical protein
VRHVDMADAGVYYGGRHQRFDSGRDINELRPTIRFHTQGMHGDFSAGR